jgi:hypothetical protein
MKHLRHINENNFNSIISDATVNDILNLARDEGYDITYNGDKRLLFIYFDYPVDQVSRYAMFYGATDKEIEKFKQCVIDIYRRLLHNGIDIQNVAERLINRYDSYSSVPLKDINDFNAGDHDIGKNVNIMHNRTKLKYLFRILHIIIKILWNSKITFYCN